MDRRSFLKNSLYASTAMAVVPSRFALAEPRPKRILVLGGTLFLGPAFVEAALADGHTLTLFNRGVTNPELFPDVEKLRGFRSTDPDDQNLFDLGRRHWDVVVDVWPHDPAVVESAAQLLKDRTKHYLYVSSIGAYARSNFAKPNLTENAPLTPWEASDSSYNRGKAECERRLQNIIGEKLTIVRPGPIKGVRDDTPDLLVWLRRLQKQKRVIAPGDGTSAVEQVDVRDIAEFLLLAIDRSIYGTFNLTGRPMLFREFLDECKSATHSDAELIWIPEAFLREQGLVPEKVQNWFLPFPNWNPDPAYEGFSQISSKKAFDAGWKTRPLRLTAIDYLAYVASLRDYVFHDTMPASKQEEVLNLWLSRSR